MQKAPGQRNRCAGDHIQDSEKAAYITYDNVKIGELQAEYLVKIAPAGNYILIGGAQRIIAQYR